MAHQLARLPEYACDCHVHVFGPPERFPYAADRRYTPDPRPREDLFALHDRLGISRGVIVQANCHGTDNTVVLDAIAARPEAYRGVALVGFDIRDDELDRLHEGGIRGIRFNFVPHLGLPPEPADLSAIAPKIIERGWHVLAHVGPADLGAVGFMLDLGLTVVIDHMARIDAGSALPNREWETLLEITRYPNCWVKVSGIDRISRQPEPYQDAVPLAAALVRHSPQRVLWGTDWPHPNHPSLPDDAVLVGLIDKIAPDPELRQALLVDNPARLYDFD